MTYRTVQQMLRIMYNDQLFFDTEILVINIYSLKLCTILL